MARNIERNIDRNAARNIARNIARYWGGHWSKKYWLASLTLGPASQLVVSAKLIMEIVWMSTPPPFVNLRLQSSSTIIFEIFWRIQRSVQSATCGRGSWDSRPLSTWSDWSALPIIVWTRWTVVEKKDTLNMHAWSDCSSTFRSVGEPDWVPSIVVWTSSSTSPDYPTVWGKYPGSRRRPSQVPQPTLWSGLSSQLENLTREDQPCKAETRLLEGSSWPEHGWFALQRPRRGSSWRVTDWRMARPACCLYTKHIYMEIAQIFTFFAYVTYP